jgi:hypothetical protein
MVTTYVPNGVEGPVVIVIVALVAVGFGLNVAAAPLGSPPAVSVTEPANPADGVMLTV